MAYNKQSNWKRKQTTPPPKPKKVRKLTPLATEEQKQQMQIGDLTYDFACRITRLFQYLTEDSDNKEYIMSKQVYRSGTSVGANVREAKHAQSDLDFLSKYSIAYKEADETEYWLSLLHDNGYLSYSQFESIHNDCVRIIKVLTAIVKKLRIKTGQQK